MRAGKSGCLFVSAGCKVDVAGPNVSVCLADPYGATVQYLLTVLTHRSRRIVYM